MIYKDARDSQAVPNQLTIGKLVFCFDKQPDPMQGVINFLRSVDSRTYDDSAFIGMAVTMPDGSVQVVTEKVGQWRKWFQDGTIMTGAENG